MKALFFSTFTKEITFITFLHKKTTCYLSLQTPTAREVVMLPRPHFISPDRIWDPSTREFESNDPIPLDLGQSHYAFIHTGWGKVPTSILSALDDML